MIVDNTKLSLLVLLVYDVDPAWTSEEQKTAHEQGTKLANCLRRFGHSVKAVPVQSSDLLSTLSSFDPTQHILFNWCESVPGIEHSEAMAAEIIEKLNFTFTGSPAKTLALSANKSAVMETLTRHGIPCPRWKVYETSKKNGWNCFPAIVKPAFEHCSIGITDKSVVTDHAELQQQIEYVLNTFHEPAIVEDFIDGREFHVSVWGNGELDILPPVEKDFSEISNVRERLCTYESKFKPGSNSGRKIKTLTPAPLTESEEKELKNVAIGAYRAIGCRDYARMDIRLRDGVFHVLDVNPNPDISDDCSLAFSAGEAGFSYGAMNSRIICLAALRHPSLMENLALHDAHA